MTRPPGQGPTIEDLIRANATAAGSVHSNASNAARAEAASGPFGNGTAPVPEATTPISTHSMEHTGVSCDHCNKTVTGFRYKCCQCRDYDLCAACEQLGAHAGHVMLRIPFPEMAHDAIRTHILKAGASRIHGRGRSPSSPVIHLGFGGISAAPGAGVDGEEEGLGRRDGHCKRRRRSGHGHEHGHHGHSHHPYHRHFDEPTSSSTEQSSDEAPFPFNYGPGGCPVVAGKKEMKKWCKYMKKNAHVHKKAAKEYAKRMSRTGASTEEGANTNGGPGAPQGFDLAAAAHQIQEFLNAAGIPIDVVELYNEWGTSHGTTGTAAAAGANTKTGTEKAPETPAAAAAATETSAPVADAPTTAEAPATNVTISANLAEGIRQMHLGSGANADAAAAAASATSTATAAAMDVEGVSAPAPTPGQAPRIYPQLNPAHLQQMLSNTVGNIGNAVRNIPIIPWNAAAASGTRAGVDTTTPGGGNGNYPELGERLQQTLNQLLSMGFSNHDGWLGRLVASKKGNLEEVLNALFPVGDGNEAGASAGAGGNAADTAHTLD